jgi:hypothetical protein
VSESSNLLRKIFRDIVRGYSQDKYRNNNVYIKHINSHDQVDLEDIHDEYLQEAQSRGVPSESENLSLIIDGGDWTEEDEAYIVEKKKYLDSLVSNKKNIGLKSQIDEQNNRILKVQNELIEKENQKEELLGRTAERYAKERVNDHYIIQCFYKDKNLETNLFSNEEYDIISKDELTEIINIHNKWHNEISEYNIQKICLEEFFFPYMPFCEDSTQFYGKPVCFLTQHQIKLIVYSRVFKSILERHDKIPEHIKKDPLALLDFASSSEKNKETLTKDEDKKGATTVFGATEKDYEYMGVDKEKGVKEVSLYEEAKKKGGSLDMNDLIALMGANPKE